MSLPTTNDVTWVHHAGTAEEFLALLSPLNALWQDSAASWVFRGHAEASWTLTPSALRAVQHDHTRTIPHERSRYLAFAAAVDFQGLPLPEDTQVHRDPELRFRPADGWDEFEREARGEVIPMYGDGLGWPPNELLSNLALAQHYGIPTRLLDWAQRPLAATYFATREAAEWIKGARPRPTDTSSMLAVWALRASTVGYYCRLEQPQSLVVTAPRATNPNLLAQSGLFTLVRYSEPTSRTDLPDLNHALESAISSRLPRTEDGPFDISLAWNLPAFRVFLLPHDLAPRLLRLLAYHHVDFGAVFPGYSGAAQSVLETELWDTQ